MKETPTSLWGCSAPSKKKGIDATFLVVACFGTVTGFEIRSYVAQRLGVEPPSILMKASTSDMWDVELRWFGNDYSAGGTTDGRRLQEREAGEDEWRDV